ncbi:MAG: acyltransferase family protein [Candidatus Competibacterales bacterium]
MDPALSTYLDIVRFSAALLVVHDHLPALSFGVGVHITFGHQAVMAFFVLSGFVIAASTWQRPLGLQDYLIRRGARIYSVALPILLLTFAICALGKVYLPAAYENFYQYDKFYLYLVLHLFFLGEVWTLSEEPYALIPYWSLGYEVWYYILFAFAVFYRGFKRFFWLVVVLLLVGYQLWLLWPVWLMGVALHRYSHRWTLSKPVGRLGFWLTVFGFFAFKTSGLFDDLALASQALWPFEGWPLARANAYLADYVVGALVVANIHCARCSQFEGLLVIQRPAAFLASYTFTLYLLHYPLIVNAEKWFALDASQTQVAFGLLLLIFISTFLVGTLTEKRKRHFQTLFTWLFARGQPLLRTIPVLNQWLRP